MLRQSEVKINTKHPIMSAMREVFIEADLFYLNEENILDPVFPACVNTTCVL